MYPLEKEVGVSLVRGMGGRGGRGAWQSVSYLQIPVSQGGQASPLWGQHFEVWQDTGPGFLRWPLPLPVVLSPSPQPPRQMLPSSPSLSILMENEIRARDCEQRAYLKPCVGEYIDMYRLILRGLDVWKWKKWHTGCNDFKTCRSKWSHQILMKRYYFL